jgi:hypothetical protein
MKSHAPPGRITLIFPSRIRESHMYGSFRVLLVCFTLASMAVRPLQAQDKRGKDESPTLAAASGVIDKVDKDTLTLKPRGADGKFQKSITLRLTGTSKLTVLSPQKRGEKLVLTQREMEAKELVGGQSITVIYAEAGKEGAVLLTAVAQPAVGK